ncbi:MAG: helix-turn-helix domain-containing protein [Candidatus Thermoplasmatota archaeon]|jgi:hypothetical protein|uniref:helix-turn-helix domain-containing protein n=1 Tax=Ferroplasma sp. Type II TaxID=261388 RepID=UPI0003894FEB|nr:helix-turn-helix domain-containing protein [Ferroplasma sp. Type II]EQB73727.1 MAG: hypothetical protein AMDU4_FER2C00049G0009 [Ferroplasma sp. Type II]MCL4312082.1 helix-turn-helix domain-containing protein [Candidatus Thermoplasmatota archaeon]HIH60494.1 hypothetical protein [Ferroplasma sp.]HII82361.1 hypothetical protein [Ferroplasma sp.]
MRNEELGPVYQFILEELKIPLDSEIEREYSIRIGERELHIDLVIKSKNTLTLIEIASRINEDIIYRIYALSHLINKKMAGGKTLQLVCAGKSMKYSTNELADRLGVTMILIPPKLYNYLSPTVAITEENSRLKRLTGTQSRITSEKAWRVICSLMSDKSPSILAISKKTGVSYGWVNTIIHELKNSGIITTDYILRIKDLDKLLNVVSWERALDGLLVETINTNFHTGTQCVTEVAMNLNRLGIDYAFTAHSSAISYGSSIMREDTVYIYLPNPSDRAFIRTYSEKEAGGCRLKVYVPDRNVMKSSKVFNSIRVVDICQNILDLTGLGMDGRIAAKDLVGNIGK